MARTTTRPQAAPEPIPVASDFAALTRESIAAQTDAGSFKRGQSYARSGHIFGAIRREATLRARCHGSSGGPYLVEATLAPADKPTAKNPRSFACDCPRGGFCKHVVALLLTWLDRPESFEARPPLADLLAGKSREELVALVVQMVHDVPELEPLLELPVAVGAAPGSAPIDEQAVRRQIAAALREGNGYDWRGRYDYDGYDGSSRIAGNLERITGLVDGYVDAGDWRNAFRVAATLVEEIAPRLTSMSDENGDLCGILAQADQQLAACLDAQGGLPPEQQLTADERRRLIDALGTIWQTSVDAGGLDIGNEGPEAIARNASPEEQQRVGATLRQSMKDRGGDEWTRSWRNRAAIGFLSLLRGGAGLSDEELLEEYRNAELWEEAAESLLKMHRVEEAISLASRRLTAALPLTTFADRLLATGEPHRIEQAITLVDDMLWEREGRNARDDEQLRQWLERQYAGHGHPEKALQLARERFKALPAKATYDAVKAAALLPDQPNEPWPALRKELLASLRKRGDWYGLIAIFLEEGEVAEAIAALKRTEKSGRGAYGWGYGTMWPAEGWDIRVAAAAEADFPAEAIGIYRRQADLAITARGRGNYQAAAQYLARVKHLLETGNRTGEWASLINELRQRNKTLRALREELDALGLV